MLSPSIFNKVILCPDAKGLPAPARVIAMSNSSITLEWVDSCIQERVSALMLENYLIARGE